MKENIKRVRGRGRWQNDLAGEEECSKMVWNWGGRHVLGIFF